MIGRPIRRPRPGRRRTGSRSRRRRRSSCRRPPRVGVATGGAGVGARLSDRAQGSRVGPTGVGVGVAAPARASRRHPRSGRQATTETSGVLKLNRRTRRRCAGSATTIATERRGGPARGAGRPGAPSLRRFGAAPDRRRESVRKMLLVDPRRRDPHPLQAWPSPCRSCPPDRRRRSRTARCPEQAPQIGGVERIVASSER